MNNIQLYIKESALSYQELDFNDDLVITNTFLNPANPFEISVGYSFSSRLPITSNNIQLLGYDVKINNRYDVKIHANGIFISEGQIRITKKDSVSLEFSYVEVSNSVIDLLNRDYTYSASIDSIEVNGSDYTLSGSVPFRFAFPDLIEKVNINTDYKIGIIDDGIKDMFYYEHGSYKSFTGDTEKEPITYETYFTNAPTIFDKRDFYISVKTATLFDSLIGIVNQQGANYKIVHNSDRISNFLTGSYTVLGKTPNDKRISARLVGDTPENPLYFDFKQLSGSVDNRVYINPFDQVKVKLSPLQLQSNQVIETNTIISGSGISITYANDTSEVGRQNYYQFQYENITNEDKTVDIFSKLTATGSTELNLQYNVYNKGEINIASATYLLSSVDTTYQVVIPSGGRLDIQVSSLTYPLNSFQLKLTENGKTFNPILSDGFTFNLFTLIKLLAEQTNNRVIIEDNTIRFIDKDFIKFDDPLTDYQYVESEPLEPLYYGIRQSEAILTSSLQQKYTGYNYADSTFLGLGNSKTLFTQFTFTDPFSTINGINFVPNHEFDIERVIYNLSAYPRQRTVRDILCTRDNANTSNITNELTNYVTEFDYVKANLGYTVLNRNDEIVNIDSIDGIIVTNTGIDTVPTGYQKSTFFMANTNYQDVGRSIAPTSTQDGKSPFYSSGRDPAIDVSMCAQLISDFDTVYSLSDFINTKYKLTLKVANRGVVHSYDAALTGTPPANKRALLTLIRNAYNYIIDNLFKFNIVNQDSTVVDVSLDSVSDFLLFQAIAEQTSFYFECVLSEITTGTNTSFKGKLLDFDSKTWFDVEGSDNIINYGVLKGYDYPAFPLIVKDDSTYCDVNAIKTITTGIQDQIHDRFIVNINYKDTVDLFDRRNKSLDNYTFFRVDSNEFDYNQTMMPVRKRTTDDDMFTYDNVGSYDNQLLPYNNLYGDNGLGFYSTSSAVVARTTVLPKANTSQFKWVPDLIVSTEDNRVEIEDVIFHSIDTTDFDKVLFDEDKVYISYRNQYQLLSPVLFTSIHYNLVDSWNDKLFRQINGKELDTFVVNIPIHDYVKLKRQNSIVTIENQDYYLLSMEYNIPSGQARCRVVKKYNFSR